LVLSSNKMNLPNIHKNPPPDVRRGTYSFVWISD
jgi:hypothetical protein